MTDNCKASRKYCIPGTNIWWWQWQWQREKKKLMGESFARKTYRGFKMGPYEETKKCAMLVQEKCVK
jgi:hypothetical protein